VVRNTTCFTNHHVGKTSKTTESTSPNVIMPARFLDFFPDCPKLAQSISTVFHLGGSRPEVVFKSGFRVWQMCFIAEIRLSELVHLGAVCFQDGGNTPEVVYCCTILLRKRGFLINLNSPKLVKCGSIKQLVTFTNYRLVSFYRLPWQEGGKEAEVGLGFFMRFPRPTRCLFFTV